MLFACLVSEFVDFGRRSLLEVGSLSGMRPFDARPAVKQRTQEPQSCVRRSASCSICYREAYADLTPAREGRAPPTETR